jgi:hypothetical protein
MLADVLLPAQQVETERFLGHISGNPQASSHQVQQDLSNRGRSGGVRALKNQHLLKFDR